MIRKEPDATGVGVWVSFVAPEFIDASPACVVGDFNGWDPNVSPFLAEGGKRIARVHLPAGRYRFRYLSGAGQWFDDPEADAWEPNDFGGADGVVEISAAPVNEPGRHTPEQPTDRGVAGELSVITQLPAARLNV